MPGTLPHTQNGFAQTAAEQHFREQLDEETAGDPTTLKFDGKVAVTRRRRRQRPVQPYGPISTAGALGNPLRSATRSAA